MTDIIEQVARAVCVSHGIDPERYGITMDGFQVMLWETHKNAAKAAILATLKAIREPTEAQKQAANEHDSEYTDLYSDHGAVINAPADVHYRAMIDVRIKEMEDGE